MLKALLIAKKMNHSIHSPTLLVSWAKIAIICEYGELLVKKLLSTANHPYTIVYKSGLSIIQSWRPSSNSTINFEKDAAKLSILITLQLAL
jgi:hypothetical protein